MAISIAHARELLGPEAEVMTDQQIAKLNTQGREFARVFLEICHDRSGRTKAPTVTAPMPPRSRRSRQ